MTFRDQLVTRGTTLLLRALRAKQVTEARRAAHELALGGEFEPLGNGLLGLLHGERSKTESPPPLGKAFVQLSCRQEFRKSRAPGPSGQPNHVQRMSKNVQPTMKHREYGSINATIVPMPAFGS